MVLGAESELDRYTLIRRNLIRPELSQLRQRLKISVKKDQNQKTEVSFHCTQKLTHKSPRGRNRAQRVQGPFSCVRQSVLSVFLEPALGVGMSRETRSCPGGQGAERASPVLLALPPLRGPRCDFWFDTIHMGTWALGLWPASWHRALLAFLKHAV